MERTALFAEGVSRNRTGLDKGDWSRSPNGVFHAASDLQSLAEGSRKWTRMHVFKTRLPPERTDAVFESAVYRFLELHADDVDDPVVSIHSEPTQGGLWKSVTLWSDDAVVAFGKHWAQILDLSAPAADDDRPGLLSEFR